MNRIGWLLNSPSGNLSYRVSCEPPIPISEIFDVIYPEFPQTVITLLNELAPLR